MKFCKEFDNLKDASNGYPKKECDGCINQIFDNGVHTCKIILENINMLYKLNQEDDSNECK
jgi:hypothetical protein